MTDSEKITLMKEIFRGRADAYGKYNETTEKGECVKEPATDAIIKGHLQGKRRIGRYPLSPSIMNGAGTWWVAVDIDDDDIGLAIQFCEALEHLGIRCYIERSKSKGYHVWVFFSDPVEAVKARALMRYGIDVLEKDTGYRIKEIFPKQNTIKNAYGSFGFGNYINLPLYGESVKDGRTVFLDSNNGYKPHPDQWNFLASIERVTPTQIEELIEMGEIEPEEQTDFEPEEAPANDEPTGYEDMLPCVSAMMGGVSEGCRDVVAFTLAKHFRVEKKLPMEANLAILQTWNQKYTPPLTDKELQTKVKSAYTGKGGKGYSSLGCDDDLIKPFCDKAVCPIFKKDSKLPDEEILSKLNDLHLTDVGNSQAFALLYGDNFRYDFKRKRWLVFNDGRWHLDGDGFATQCVKEIAKTRLAAAALIEDDEFRKKAVKWALTSEAKFRLSGALELAQSEPPLPASTEQFDTNQYLLGCANGVIDLRTGELRQGKQEDYIMKVTSVKFNPHAECQRWLQFLDEIFLGNIELIDFSQKAIGYSLTGDTSEQCLFICYGTGWNGKSKCLSILRALLGDYARNTPFSTFTERYRDTATNDLAALAGVRLVTSSEVGEGKQLNEARIKAMTGGDPITARFLYGEFFDYLPAYKVWLAVNHKPIIKGTDEGIWRRIRLIPFEASFKENPDPYIEEKLKTELEGILRWAVEGCLKWQKERLGMVEKVKTATEEYQQESDVIAQFLADCTVENESAKVKASDLYKAYKAWCEENGEDPISGNAFGRRMTEKGYEKEKGIYYYYKGIGFLAAENTKSG